MSLHPIESLQHLVTFNRHASLRGELARSLGRLARITADLKDPREAIALRLEALPIQTELAEARPDDPSPRADIAATWYELSKLYRLTNQADAAANACSTAIAPRADCAKDCIVAVSGALAAEIASARENWPR